MSEQNQASGATAGSSESVLAIETCQLTKRYASGVVAVDSLSVSVRQGEIFGFLGPNGAGKTTTIRLLLDLIRPSAGWARIYGADCQRHSVSARGLIGYLPDEPKLYPEATGHHLIRLVTDLRPGQVADHYTRYLCEQLNVDVHTPVGQLSHGNRQKIGLLLALIAHPRVIILDEPTSGLDPLLQQQVLALLQEVRAEGRTVFFSSHNLPEVEHVCDRVAFIRKGRLAGVENIQQLKHQRLQRVQISFAERVNLGEFTMIPGVKVLDSDGLKRVVHLEVTGDIDPVIRTAAKYHTVSLETEHPSLEEVFMRYYGGEHNG